MDEKDAKGGNAERTIAAHSNGFCQRCQFIIYNQEKPAIGQLRNRSAAWVFACRICQRYVPFMLHMYDTGRVTSGHLCEICTSAPGSEKADEAENMYKKAKLDHIAFVEGGGKFLPAMKPGNISNMIPTSSPRPAVSVTPAPVAHEAAQAAAVTIAQAAAAAALAQRTPAAADPSTDN